MKSAGKVILVSAGPGSSDFLTLKGKRELERADTVVYDRLVSSDILSMIPKNAEKIYVGKQANLHTVPQEEINNILIQKAREGKRVVRLKGGDCFLFGRGGEELLALKAANIEFDAVSGVSSALAVPALSGIPVTHRGLASSVHIIAGHSQKNNPLNINFESLVKAGGTLVFLMGAASLKKITEGLLCAGAAETMPCCVIERGASTEQKTVLGSLSNIAEKCTAVKIGSPAVIVVGEVCSLSESLNLSQSKPLSGKRVIVTRPEGRGNELQEGIKELGGEVIPFPCIKTESIIKGKARQIAEEIINCQIVAFTSPFGVKTAVDELLKSGFDSRIFYGRKIAAIGEGTERELKKYGLLADFVPKKYNGASLGRLISKNTKGGSVLLLRVENGGTKILEELKKSGTKYRDVAIYKTSFLTYNGEYVKSLVCSSKADYVAFTSSSCVKGFVNAVGEYKSFTGICIGEKTADEAAKYGIKTITAQKETISAMINALTELCP